MRVTYDPKGRFVANCDFDSRHIPREAGWLWCPETKTWETFVFKYAARLRAHFDEAAKNKFDSVSVVETPWAGRIFVPHGTRLLSHQEEGVRFAMGRNHSYFNFGRGHGKTPAAIATAQTFALDQGLGEGVVDISLVVCMPSLVTNWEREFKTWAPNAKVLSIRSFKDLNNCHGLKYYDYVIVADSLFQNEDVQKVLALFKFGTCIVDEAQRFINERAIRTRVLLGFHPLHAGLVHQAKKVVYLSGTPIRNKPIELFPILNASAWNTIAYNKYHSYGVKFCNGRLKHTYGGNMAWDYSGDSNLDQLKKRINPFVISSKDFKLPVKLRERVVTLEGKVPKDVRRIEKVLLRKKNLASYIGEANVGKLATYRRELSESKVKTALPYIKEILESSDDSLLIFGIHTASLEMLNRELSKFKSRLITGKIKNLERDKIERLFQKKKIRVIVANIQTMVGLNLTAGTHCIFFESSWTPSDNEQARDRIYRIGQKKKVLSTHLVLAGTLDEYVLMKVLKKQKTINKLF